MSEINMSVRRSHDLGMNFDRLYLLLDMNFSFAYFRIEHFIHSERDRLTPLPIAATAQRLRNIQISFSAQPKGSYLRQNRPQEDDAGFCANAS